METPQEKLIHAMKLIQSAITDLGISAPLSVATVESATSAPRAFDERLLQSVEMGEDELKDVYSIRGDDLDLKVKVDGGGEAETQRKLAHVLLFGYRALLGIREVAGSKLLVVAKGWDISTNKFVRNLDGSQHIQIRNKGRGKDPLFSLKPGSVEKIKDEIKSLLKN